MDYESNQLVEQKTFFCGAVGDQLPPLSAKYPWLVSQNLEAEDDIGVQSFYILHNRLPHYQCRIPELLGRRIRGCFHGWVVLSNQPHNVMWSLWNPITLNFIRLPPLFLKDGDFEDIGYCCLSAPPDDPTSIFLITRIKKPNIVFCRLDRKRKKSTWTEMSYAKQLKRVTGKDCIIDCPTCCSGKVYALGLETNVILQVDIVVNDREVVISLLPFREFPFPFFDSIPQFYWLKGSSTELFCLSLGFDAVAKNTLVAVHLFKLEMTSTTSTWEEIKDLKDAVFFVDLTNDDYSVFYNPAIGSGSGGYVHIRGDFGTRIYSYHVKDKDVSLLHMPCLVETSHVSLWECRLKGDHEEAKPDDKDDEIVIRSIMEDEVELSNITNESHLLNIPFHVLEMIMEFCVGVEYMKFRATCKRCHLAAPLIQWRNKAALRKLQTYSLLSPWLMMLKENQGTMDFIDPIFGDKYFMNTLPVSIDTKRLICCSRYGWLLFYSNLGYLVFFNPFTSDVRKLPTTPHKLENLCFSAPPTSAHCKVVGFTTRGEGHVYILDLVGQHPLWHRLDLDYGGAPPYAFCFPTFYGRDLYALCNAGKLVVFKEMTAEGFSHEVVVAEAPRFCLGSVTQYFLVKHDEHLLLVTMGEHGEFIEVFQLNDSTKEWKRTYCLGRHMIYICGASCLCIEAKTPKMQNKIFFPRLHSKNGKIVFYSLETCRYHTFNGEHIEETYGCFFETKHFLYPHAWIEPHWQ